MRDLHSHNHYVVLFAPIAAQTNSDSARVSEIIDLRPGPHYEGCELVLINGTNTDTTATFAVLVEDGDAANLSDNAAVADDDLLGTEVLAAFTFADDGECRKIGYRGNKRYVRVTVTPTGNNSGDWFMSGVAHLGYPSIGPTPNPPQ